MPAAQKMWLTGTIVLFVILIAFGWYFTVAQALQRSIRESHQSISGQFDQTKQVLMKKDGVGQTTQENLDKMKTYFQNVTQDLKDKQAAEQAILDNVKEQIKQTSTH